MYKHQRHFVRSGNIIIATGILWVAGENSYDWSARATSKHWSGADIPSAYDLVVEGSKGINPSGGPSDRWGGIPLRCLSTVIDM